MGSQRRQVCTVTPRSPQPKQNCSLRGRSQPAYPCWADPQFQQPPSTGGARPGWPHGFLPPPGSRCSGQESTRSECPYSAPSWSGLGPKRPSSLGTLGPPPPPASTGGCEPLVVSPRRPFRGPDHSPGQNTISTCGGARTDVKTSSTHGIHSVSKGW